MRCRKARSYLPARCDGTLSEAKRLGLEEHLSGCSSCRRDAFYFAELVEAAGSMEPQPVKCSPDFNLRLRGRIAEYEARQRVAAGRVQLFYPKGWAVATRRLAVAATCVVVAAAGVTGYMMTVAEETAELQGADKLHAGADTFYRGEMDQFGASSEQLDTMLDAYLAGEVPSYRAIPVDDSAPVSKTYLLQIEPGTDPMNAAGSQQFLMPVVSTQEVSAKASY